MAIYVTDEVKKQIGIETEPVTWEVERGAIRRFADAVGDRSLLYYDEKEARKTRFGGMIAPPTFVRSMLLRSLPKYTIPNQPKNSLDGGSEWEFLEPIRPGDRITVSCKLSDILERETRTGALVFVDFEYKYVNQFDQVCVIQRQTIVHR